MTNSTTNISISFNGPNKKIVAALLKAEKIANDPSVRGYDDLNDFFANLKK